MKKTKRETMMMPYIPAELLEEILSRVPATSLKRLRSTCKAWKALFKNKQFSEKHFRKASKESLYLMSKEYRLCSISLDLNVVPPSIEFKGRFGPKDPHSQEVDIAKVFHCDGLLLCNTKDDRLVVWNPCSGETRWIQPIHDNNYDTEGSLFSLGYKIEKSCHNYKILRCWKNPKSEIEVGVGFEIYEFSSNSWRVLDHMDSYCFELDALSLKGNTYWLAYDCEEEGYKLICFDFTTERTKRLCLPLPEDISFTSLSVLREEKLSLLNINNASSSSKMEIWLTNNNVDTEADLSWSKFIIMDLLCPGEYVSIESSLIIEEEKKVFLMSCITSHRKYSRSKLVCFDIGRGHKYYKQITCNKGNQWPRCYFYVPSLLRIH